MLFICVECGWKGQEKELETGQVFDGLTNEYEYKDACPKCYSTLLNWVCPKCDWECTNSFCESCGISFDEAFKHEKKEVL